MRFRGITAVTLLVLSACTTRIAQLRPEDILPSGATVAYITGLTPQNAGVFSQWIAEVGDVPLSEEAASNLAVVQMPGGRRAWIHFLPVNDPQSSFPYRIAVSDPAAEALLGTGATALSASEEFVMASAAHTEGAWAFRRAEHAWQGIRFGTGSVRIVMPAALPVSDPPRLMTSPLNSTALVLHAGSSDVIRALMEQVPNAEDAMAADAILRTVFAELAGNGGAFRSDVLPLLHDPFSLFAGPAEDSAHMPFVLAGSSPDAQKSTDRLHEFFRKRTLLMSEQQRTFDSRFPSRNIRIDPAALDDSEDERDGWHIHTTVRPDDDDTLVSAVRDERFIIGTDTGAVLRAISEEWVAQGAGDGLTPAAIGWMDRPALPPALRALTSEFSKATGTDGAFKWVVERGNGMLALTIQTQ